MSLFAYKNETKKSKTTIKSKINIYLTNWDAHFILFILCLYYPLFMFYKLKIV